MDKLRSSGQTAPRCPRLVRNFPGSTSTLSLWVKLMSGVCSLTVRGGRTNIFPDSRAGPKLKHGHLGRKREPGSARIISPTNKRQCLGATNMAQTPRRGVRQSDLPLRLRVVRCSNGRFQYLILRNDGTVAKMSQASFDTADKARAAGLPVLQRRSMGAKLTPMLE